MEQDLLNKKEQRFEEVLALLSALIGIQSFSKEEEKTADLLEGYLIDRGLLVSRKGNNVWVKNRYFHPAKPTILLNSHHDTVKPNKGYTKDPFNPEVSDGKLFGLGSNDAGGALISLLITFLHYHDHEDLKYNLIWSGTAEEEISGKEGVESILEHLGEISFGIVGEPTGMKMAVAEKGLMVLDCYAKGQSGHAARDLGVNAIYKAMEDIEWIRNYQFEKVSDHLGPVKMSVTMINAGYQHNVIPDVCHYVVDVRTTDAYSNEETYEIINEHTHAEVNERSFRLSPSYVPKDHVLVKAAEELKIEMFGSPTTSDQALMSFPTIKMGPGLSERSHSADEFIFLDELREGPEKYIELLDKVLQG
ncbi:MAG: M20 family metallo-hydrolase [Cyclobacteriaceae bacterium]